MANLTTSEDLVNDILFRAGEPTDGTSDFDAQALQYLNRAYQAIWEGGGELDPNIDEVWWWLRKDDQGTIILSPVVDSGTVSVTNNSANIVFSASISTDLVGYHFKVDDHADVFIITAHGADTTATLEAVYTGDTNASASYKAFKLDYTLASDLLYINAPMSAWQDNQREIKGISLRELKKKWPLNITDSGVPRNFAMIGQQSVRFSHFGGTSSTDFIKLDYEYTRQPDDLTDDAADTPAVPRQYRKVLADWGLAFLLADKEDTRVQSVALLAQRGLLAMAHQNRKHMITQNDDFGILRPRQQQLLRLKGPLRTESGNIIGF